MTFAFPYRLIFKQHNPLDDPLFQLALGMHIREFVAAIDACTFAGMPPLLTHRSHCQLTEQIALAFPQLAAAVGAKAPSVARRRQVQFVSAVLADAIPDIQVNAPEDILYLRDHLSDELQCCRAELGKLAADLRADPLDGKFEEEVEDALSRHVRPALAELRSKLSRPTRRVLKHLASGWTIGGSLGSLNVLMMQGVQLPYALLATAIGGLGIAALQARAEEWNIKRDSSFAFILDVQSRLKRRSRKG